MRNAPKATEDPLRALVPEQATIVDWPRRQCYATGGRSGPRLPSVWSPGLCRAARESTAASALAIDRNPR